MKVEVGQIWASNDARDVAANHNQRREVILVDPIRVRFDGKPSRMVRHYNGIVVGHRLVVPVTREDFLPDGEPAEKDEPF